MAEIQTEPDAFVHQDPMPTVPVAPEQLEDTQRKYLNRRLVDLDDDDENSPVFIEVVLYCNACMRVLMWGKERS